MRILSFLLFLSISSLSFAQTWQFVDDKQTPQLEQIEREVIPSKYATVKLNLASLNKTLKQAPLATDRNGSVIISLPLPDGSMERFEVVNSSVMQRELASKYSHIQSYKAYSLENPSHIARLTVGNKGLRAAIRSTEGEIYIDPYGAGEKDYYISYYIVDENGGDAFTPAACGTINANPPTVEELEREREITTSLRDPNELIPMRTYRVAIACTGEWGAAQGNTVADAMETIVLTLDRANLVYENELSTTFVLVNDNDQLVHIDGNTDPYNTANSGGALIGQNTNVLNGAIGQNSYDIGHIFARCTDTGGIAALNSICNIVNKAAGATCFFGSNPTNGIIRIFTHEMGHQMGANHTMNNCSNGGAAGNENSSTSFEVGSGSTVMSYSGACGPDNTGRSFLRYHIGSIEEIYRLTRGGGNADCAVKDDFGNRAPEPILEYEDGFYIPISTPFVLEGDATDLDGDNLTYSWEQFDLGPISNVGSPVGNAPIFETLPLSTSKSRFFPRILTVLSNGFDRFELLPTYSREMTFRFTVRDNSPVGGTVEWEEVEFFATDEAGPFRVSYPNEEEIFEVGQEINVEWDVANTDGDLVDCQRVDILLSVDAGLTWGDIVLASNVPNDGSHPVIMPNTPADFARVIVRAHDNVFYDIGNSDVRLVEPTTPSFFMDVFPKSVDLCLPTSSSFTLESAGFGGFEESVTYEIVDGLPPGAVADFSANNVDPNQDITLEMDLTNVTVTGEYTVTILATAGQMTQTREILVAVTGTDFTPLNTIGPDVNEMGVSSLPTFSWVDVPDAELYDFQLATSPSFSPESMIVEINGTPSTSYSLEELLEKNTLFFWRVRASNDCAAGDFITTRAFGTETLNCNVGEATNLPLQISQSGTPSVEATIPVTSTGEVVDIEIKNIQGIHERVSDLAGILISPNGTEIILWEEDCGNSSNYSLGFNDAAPGLVSCPINTGQIFQPITPFAGLTGEESQGIWRLRIEDRDSGNGGTLSNVELEICSNTSLDPPALINNNVLQLPPASGQRIQLENLLATDADNTAEELVFTLVSNPNDGDVYLGNTALIVGDQFTQQDINTNRLRYRHDPASSASTDAFSFTIEDGNGGWVGITQFDIEIDGAFTSSVADIDDTSFISVYPNPVNNNLNVEFSEYDGSPLKVSLYNLDGRLIISKPINSATSILEMGSFNTGVYLLEIENGENRYQKRILKVE